MKTLDQLEPRTPIRAGDLPLAIYAPGSYYLTEPIDFAGQNVNGITINSSNVSIDLGGFALRGPGASVGTTGSGIKLTGDFTGISISNGSLEGWREKGCDLGLGTLQKITGITATYNGAQGIYGGNNAVVSQCVTANNGMDGFALRTSGSILNCSSHGDGGDGFNLAENCSINFSTAEISGGYGIQAASGASISNCSVNGAIQSGIFTEPSVITACSSQFSGATGIYSSGGCISNCLAYGSLADGITMIGNGVVSNCAANGNGGFGILAGASIRITGNTCSSNSNGSYYLAGQFNVLDGNFGSGGQAGIFDSGGKNMIVRNTIVGASSTFAASSATSAFVFAPLNMDTTVSPWANLFIAP